MKKPKCKLCGSPHWTYEPHAINKERLTDAINESPSAINSLDTPSSSTTPSSQPVAGDSGLRGSNGSGSEKESGARYTRTLGRTPNRRSREAYNSYMKDYMRAYRERKPTT